MKNTKVIDIFKDGNIVIPIYLIKHYKELNLKLEEFLFLMYLYDLGNHYVFDPNKFSSDLNLKLEDIMNYVSILTDKGFITVEVLKNDKGLMEEVIVLDSFYDKLSLFTMKEVNKIDKSDSNIYELIEKEFGRVLGSIEYEIITAWLDSNISEELIHEALKEAVFNGVSNLKYMDTILYEWGKAGIKTKEDVEKRRKNRKASKDNNKEEIDLDIVDWNWFDDDE